MKNDFGYKAGKAVKALQLDGYYVWDCSVIKSGGKYHMFSSRWKEEWGFGWNWVYNSEIAHFVSDKPVGPYTFLRVVLPRRGREYFDGMNTHNTCVRYWNGKYYLYYCVPDGRCGVAESESPTGPFRDIGPMANVHGIDPAEAEVKVETNFEQFLNGSCA